MAVPRLQKSLADYVAMAICPVLIMALVGSLVFFLLEIFYQGQYESRLQWVLFFFIFAVVLIARISMMQDGGARAPIYGMLLGIATFICMCTFVEYQTQSIQAIGWIINIALLAIIWWCAHKLTYDCTYLEEDADATGKGILDAAGLGEAPPEEGQPSNDLDSDDDEEPPPAETVAIARVMPLSWWEEYRRERELKRKKSHTPGVWVVYFSLAALPLFGLGQLFVPAGDSAKRSYVFWLLAIYVASGLGLLLCTSFLGLRRYLRQRKVAMPAAVTGAWLAMGTALVVALVGVGLLIPLPTPGDILGKPTFMGSRDRQASRYAIKRDSKGKGEGQASRSTERDPDAKAGSGTQRDSQSGQPQNGRQGEGGKSQSQGGQPGPSNNTASSEQTSGASGKQANRGGDAQSSKRQGSKENGSQASSEQGNQQEGARSQGQGERSGDQGNLGNNSSANKSQAGERSDRSKDGDESSESEPSKSRAGGARLPEDRAEDRRSKSDQSGDSKEQESGSSNESGDGTGSSSSWGDMSQWTPLLEETTGAFGQILKWLAIIVGVVVGGYLLFRFLVRSNAWFRSLWLALQALFARRPGNDVSGSEADTAPDGWSPRPFAEYADPFLTGAAEREPPAHVVRYSFEALESWAWEHHLQRQPEETPLEFAERIGGQVPALDPHVRRLADLYARVTYARQTPNQQGLAILRLFWQHLTGTSNPQKAVVE